MSSTWRSTLLPTRTGLSNNNRLWNLLFFGVKEESGENCKEKVVKIIAEKLNIRDTSSIRFCDVHRISRRRMGPQRSRPIICRFTCREDRERVYKAKSTLKNTNIRINDDVPEEVREIRRNRNFVRATVKAALLFFSSLPFSSKGA